jgi:hypothetical protein
VDQGGQRAQGRSGFAPHRDGADVEGFGAFAGDRAGEGAGDIGEAETRQIAGQAEESGGVFAVLHDDAGGFAAEQQGAVGLDRSGELDLFTLAIREVGGSEPGCRCDVRCHAQTLPKPVVDGSGRFSDRIRWS